MKKFFIILFLTAFSSAYAGGHLSEKDKIGTLKCTGLYYANSMIPPVSYTHLTLPTILLV